MQIKLLLIVFCAVQLFLAAESSCEQNGSVWIEKKTFQINEHLPRMRFDVLIEEGDIAKITIFEQGEKNPFQTITDLDPNGECEPLGNFSYSVEDINFDGYNDFKFTCWRGATGNESFRYLIYNKTRKKFYFSREFADFAGTKADPKRKVITTYRNQGSAGQAYVAETYKWIKGKLTLVEEERQEPSEKNPNKFIRIKEKRIKGKMTVVEQQIININD